MIPKCTTRLLPAITIVLALCWALGLFAFIKKIEAYQAPLINNELLPTDTIVVLTGGSERLTAGINLLKAGKGKKLFISGVYPSVKETTLLSHYDIEPELATCCIELGHQAGNTIGNANETLTYMTRENFQSMYLVTANYHMPRSLLLLRQEMPNAKIVPFSVSPDTVNIKSWWTSPGTAALLVIEYCKYILTLSHSFIGVLS